MANWLNARLAVTGRRNEVLTFSRLCRARPASCFAPDMLYGETAELGSRRVERLGPGLASKVYHFQICTRDSGDGCEHFCGVSRGFPALCFSLRYFDPGGDAICGSFLIRQGRSRSYV